MTKLNDTWPSNCNYVSPSTGKRYANKAIAEECDAADAIPDLAPAPPRAPPSIFNGGMAAYSNAKTPVVGPGQEGYR